jgi:putative FmdB family regulatory protein
MPLYEYRCSACGHTTEAIQSVHDDPLTVCESCGGELKKQVSSPAFQFKGSGWYVSDYGRGNASAGEKPKEGPAEGGKTEGEKTEGGKTEGGGPDAKPTDKPTNKPSDKPSTGGGEGSSPKDGGKSSG